MQGIAGRYLEIEKEAEGLHSTDQEIVISGPSDVSLALEDYKT